MSLLRRTMRDQEPAPRPSRQEAPVSPSRSYSNNMYTSVAAGLAPPIDTTTTTTTTATAPTLGRLSSTPRIPVYADDNTPTPRESYNDRDLEKRDMEKIPSNRTNRITQLTKSQEYRLRAKNHFLAMVGEFVGTVLFIFFAFGGTQVANIPSTTVTGATTSSEEGTTAAPNTSSLLFIALSFGFSLTVNAWVFFRVSGGLFNPAVSLGLALVGVITPIRAILLTIAQCLGAITGAAIIQALTPGPLYVTTRLTTGMSRTRGLFMEMFLTAMLMITILLLAAEKSKTTFLAPVGIGLALFITQLVGVYWTGGSVNPARSLGPDVVLKSFPSYHWIYWVGPILGACLASGFYLLLKVLHYETVVPGQDAEDLEDANKKLIAVQGPGLSDAREGGLVGSGNMASNLGSHNMGADVSVPSRSNLGREKARRMDSQGLLG